MSHHKLSEKDTKRETESIEEGDSPKFWPYLPLPFWTQQQQYLHQHHLQHRMYEYQPSKKQRRQAAAMVVSSIFTMGKKSTAQPRPKLHVPPRGIGPVTEPNKNDVLSGRGGRINAHEGNVQFRDIVTDHKAIYLAKSTKKLEKAHIAAKIVEQIRSMNPAGRFLKEDADTGLWWDIGDAKAIKKVGQALREDAQEVRKDDDGDDDDKKKPGKKSPISPASSLMPPPSRSTQQSLAQQQQQLIQQAQQQRSYNQLYDGVGQGGTKAATLNKRALDAMAQQQPPSNVAFGRHFTPTEMSGATMSTISGMSGISTVDSNIHGTPSALSMQSWGVGSLGMGSLGSLRSSQLSGSNSRSYSRHSAGHYVQDPRTISRQPGQPGTTQMRGMSANTSALGLAAMRTSSTSAEQNPGSSGVSDLTYNFMSMSGIPRSPSFGDLSVGTGMSGQPMSDASFVELMTEDKAVGDAIAASEQPSQNQASWLRMSSTSDPRSSGSAASARRPRTGTGQSSGFGASSGVSIASERSMMESSIKSVGTDVSWLNPYKQNRPNQNAPTQEQWDARSMMSDISDTVLALDLAGPKESV